MRTSKIRLAALALVSGITLGGCAYGYDPYGYGGGVSVGYGNYGYGSGYGYGYGPYGYYDPRYSGYGGIYGSPFGWYGNYYYPGSGIYVYDRYRTRYVWNDRQRRYWRDRHDRWRDRGGRDHNKENWSGFGRGVREWANRNDLSGSTTTNSTSSRRNRSVERSSVTTSSDRGVRRVRVERRERNRDRNRDD
jgi:hypothetical protein